MLAADFGNLQRDTEMVNQSEADWFHVDIMDGVFVPNISFGMPVMKAITKHCKKVMDVHLMISPVDPYIEAFAKAGADVITTHVEAGPHIHRTVQAIRAAGAKAGVALNPGTPASAVEYLLDMVDLVCVMTVNPGFGGQKFIHSQIAKVEAHHRDRYLALLSMVENGTVFKREQPITWKCSICGYIVEGTEPPPKCPSCKHPKEFYEPANMDF